VSPLTEARKGKTGEGKGVSGVQPLNILGSEKIMKSRRKKEKLK